MVILTFFLKLIALKRNEKQMNYMRNGGNINLKAFFARYKIAPDAPIDFKFKTKAAQYYRDKVCSSFFKLAK
jgi:ADP-ribosylation factor GTPase-activating protein 1